jgi:hypothetical protein
MKIDNYFFGSITVDGQEYRNDVIIYPDAIRCNWRRKEGHSVAIEDLQEVMNDKPDLLIIGTGAYGFMKLKSSTQKVLQENNIKIIEVNSKQACEIFNKYIQQGKKVVGAFHLTC